MHKNIFYSKNAGIKHCSGMQTPHNLDTNGSDFYLRGVAKEELSTSKLSLY